jgi:hypothetical protein
MIGVVITLKSPTAFPPVYVMRRITGSTTTTHTGQQLQAYLERNQYRRIQKDTLRPHEQFLGLWVAEGTASDGDDTESIHSYMRRIEGTPE